MQTQGTTRRRNKAYKSFKKPLTCPGIDHLAVVETGNVRPNYLDLHCNDVAHTLILGATGSGKSYLPNLLLPNAQKHAPTTSHIGHVHANTRHNATQK